MRARRVLPITAATLLTAGALGFAAVHVVSPKIKSSGALAGASVRLEVEGAADVCSATHIGANRFITASHCTWHGPVTVKTDTGGTAVAEVLWSAKPYDLALLYASGLKARRATVDCALVEPGTLVTAAGNPLGMEFIRAPGIIVSKLQTGEQEVGEEKTWRERIVADVTVAPGSSGGGLFNDAGRLVGVVVGMVRSFRYAIVIPSSTVCKLLGR